MILSDGTIHRHLISQALRDEPHTISIKPWHPDHIQPASYEVHLGNRVRFMWQDGQPEGELGHINLMPEQFLLAHTVETLELPPQIAAQVTGKSSLGRLGLQIHKTAGWIDPGFHGQIVLEIRNFGHDPVPLVLDMAIAQLVFMRLDAPAERPYGTEGLGSHYQNQTGAVPSAASAVAT